MIEIQGRKIGIEYPPLVIAEIGINHEGSLAVAKQMVDAAYRAGIEVVKHQTHIVEDEMSAAAQKVSPGNANVSISPDGKIMVFCRCKYDENNVLQCDLYESVLKDGKPGNAVKLNSDINASNSTSTQPCISTEIGKASQSPVPHLCIIIL